MPKKRSHFQNKSELFATKAVLGALGAFPFSTSIKIGESIGRVFSRFPGRLRFVGLRNLELALPELSPEEHERVLRGSFESLGRQLALVSHFPYFTPEKVKEVLDVEGLDFVKEAQTAGRGIVIFSGHLGGWEMSHLAFPALGFRWNVLVRRIDNALVENFVENLRTRLGSRTIDKKDSARTMLRLLQKGELLGIVADLNMQEQEGTFVDFFGIPASTTTGLARLALRTNAAIIPLFIIWQPERKKYLFKLEPPVEYETTSDAERDVRDLTQKITKVIEKYVRLYPEQWLWIHKRWNTRPAGEPNFYAKDFQVQSLSRVQSPKSKVQSQTEVEPEG